MSTLVITTVIIATFTKYKDSGNNASARNKSGADGDSKGICVLGFGPRASRT